MPIDAFDRPGSSATGDTAAEGTSGAAARADHKHAREAADANLSGTPTTSAVGDSASVGVSTTGSRSDHKHGREAFATTSDIANIAATESAGTAATVPHGDHVHALPALGAWTGYTPVLTQGVTVTKTVTYAKWQQFGKTVFVQALLSVTGSGTASTLVTVDTPATAAQQQLIVGSGYVYDASTNQVYKVIVELSTTGLFQFRPTHTIANDTIGATMFTAGLASGDLVNFSATYEST